MTPASNEPYQRTEQIFPKLPREGIDRLARYGEIKTFKLRHQLFRRGESKIDFYLMIDGGCNIYDTSDRITTILGERQFTGEIDLPSDQKLFVTGRISKACSVLRILKLAPCYASKTLNYRKD